MIAYPLPQQHWDAAPRRAPQSRFEDFGSNPAKGATITYPKDRVLAYDFSRISVGTAVYKEGPTGATVLGIDGGARTYVDRLGGAVGISGAYEFNHAICFAGGSVHGLGAVAGVTDALLEDGIADTRFTNLAHVSGAVIYDFGMRDNAVVPDAALGRAAWQARQNSTIDIGRVGAGIGATVGKTAPGNIETAGQGAAFFQLGELKILALTIVNSIGVIVDRDGTVLRGNIGQDDTRRHPFIDSVEFLSGDTVGMRGGNTTVSAIVTNVRLSDLQLKQFARQVHASMHRAIQPFATMLDGDCLFAITTDEVDAPSELFGRPVEPSVAIGTIASETMWDAVIESVR